MKRILFISVVAALVLYGMWSGLQRNLYRIISQETLTGIIRCINSPDKSYDFYLYYFPVERGQTSEFRFLKLKGREWLFEGELIKWKRPLNLLGLKTAHRPIRIYDSAGNSYYLDVGAPLVGAQIGRAQGPPLRAFAFKIARLLPIVDTSFISIVKQLYIPKVKFGIYATNTGYLVRKIRQGRRP